MLFRICCTCDMVYMLYMLINSASHLKYLGVIIDSKLNWIPHITHVKNKILNGI